MFGCRVFCCCVVASPQLQKDSGVAGAHKQGMGGGGAGSGGAGQKKNSMYQLEALAERMEKV